MIESLKDYALFYARLGLAVFPVKAWGNTANDFKAPLIQGGFQAASTDPGQIESWWSRWPEANIGIATGKASGGLTVIDLDVKEEKGIDGRVTLREWEAERGKFPENTWLSITGSGGYHYFYRDSSGTGCHTGLYEGIDIRGNGGYVVAPPSRHFNKRRYEWEQDPMLYSLADADSTVLNFLAGPAPKGREKKPFQVPEQIPEGQRTDAMFKLICGEQARGMSDEAIKAAVRTENELKCVPPLTEQELEREVFPALKRYEKGTAPYMGKDYSKRTNWNEQPGKTFDIINARELQQLDIPPLEFVVEDLLPLGLTVLGAPPKSFKSYLCLGMVLCICRGVDFLGFKTKKCGCLYLDLESTRRRPKNRIEQILKGQQAPDNLYIVTQASPMDQGFAGELRKAKEEHPDIGVVVIDVFKKIRPPKKANVDPYERDYEDYGGVKTLADEMGLALILVSHTTKMKHPDDPFNELTGSSGTMGSIDVAMVIKKENRDDETAKLYITGRDLEEQCYEIKFNKEEFQWNKLGTHKAMEMLRLEYEYRSSPIIKTIKKLVDQNNGKWTGTASEIISASKYFTGMQIYDDVRKVGSKISEYAQWMEKWDFIEFHKDRTKKTSEYQFLYNCPFDVTNVTDVIDVTNVTLATDTTLATDVINVTDNSIK